MEQNDSHRTASQDWGRDFYPAMTMFMGRVEGKIDQLIATQNAHKETTDDHEVRLRNLEQIKAEDHEDRLRMLEKSKWRQLGALGVAGAVIGAFGSMVLAKVLKFIQSGVFPS